MSRLLQCLDDAGCEVIRKEGKGGKDAGKLEILLPGWDAELVAADLISNVGRLFRDRLIIRVNERGEASFRIVYWAGFQPMLHLGIAAAFAWEAWFSPASTQLAHSNFLLALILANAIPPLVVLMGARWSWNVALASAKS